MSYGYNRPMNSFQYHEGNPQFHRGGYVPDRYGAPNFNSYYRPPPPGPMAMHYRPNGERPVRPMSCQSNQPRFNNRPQFVQSNHGNQIRQNYSWNGPTTNNAPYAGKPHQMNERFNGNRQQHQKHSQNRQQMEREYKPVVFNFNCETCDRRFNTEEKFKEHTDGHKTCHIDGCTYTAAPKLVKIHYDFQHKTGLAKKIWTADSKEEIDKWRAERKKNFPTKVNVEQKEQEKQARIERGEVIETEQFGKMRGKGRNRGGGGRGGRRGRGGRFNQNDNMSPVTDEDPKKRFRDWKNQKRKLEGPDNTDDVIGDMKTENSLNARDDGQTASDTAASPAKKMKKTETAEKSYDKNIDPLGIVIANAKTSDSEDSEIEEVSSKTDVPLNPVESASDKTAATSQSGALGSLIHSYDASSADEIDDAAPSIKSTAEQTQVSGTTSYDTNPANRVTESRPEVDSNEKILDKVHSNQHKSNRNRRQPRNQRRPATLLQKLLANEIRHERNVIMQCIRHVVDKNFFGIEKSPENNTSDKIQKTVSMESENNNDMGVINSSDAITHDVK